MLFKKKAVAFNIVSKMFCSMCRFLLLLFVFLREKEPNDSEHKAEFGLHLRPVL